jgi:hypothetical protein
VLLSPVCSGLPFFVVAGTGAGRDFAQQLGQPGGLLGVGARLELYGPLPANPFNSYYLVCRRPPRRMWFDRIDDLQCIEFIPWPFTFTS